jgi:hypothetical protein
MAYELLIYGCVRKETEMKPSAFMMSIGFYLSIHFSKIALFVRLLFMVFSYAGDFGNGFEIETVKSLPGNILLLNYGSNSSKGKG